MQLPPYQSAFLYFFPHYSDAAHDYYSGSGCVAVKGGRTVGGYGVFLMVSFHFCSSSGIFPGKNGKGCLS